MLNDQTKSKVAKICQKSAATIRISEEYVLEAIACLLEPTITNFVIELNTHTKNNKKARSSRAKHKRESRGFVITKTSK